MEIIPQNSKILIDIEKNNKTESGLILGDNIIGEVGTIIKGDSNYKKGERVMFKSWALDTIKVDDEDYSFIDVKDILGKVK